MLTLVRDKYTATAILGRLCIGSTCICYTLENAIKAIPAGLYSIENSKSPKFKRELPLIHNNDVPSRRGVRVHAGNTYKDSAACVLVGMGRDFIKGTISESKPAETMVTMLCRSMRQLAIVDSVGAAPKKLNERADSGGTR